MQRQTEFRNGVTNPELSERKLPEQVSTASSGAEGSSQKHNAAGKAGG